MGHILILGGAGFLGTNLSLKLLSLGYKVTVIDNFYSSSANNPKIIKDNENYIFIEADLVYLDTLPTQIDYIFNLACPASPIQYQKDPIYTLDVCYLGAKKLLDHALKLNIGIFHASTSEIYGDPSIHPQPESYWGNVNSVGPRACYDEGKRVAETLCYEYSNRHGLDVCIGRIFNTYGPYMNRNDGRVISNFIVQALNNKPITIYGNGHQTRSFCYVDDLVDAFISILSNTLNGKHKFGPFNLGNPLEISVLDIAHSIIRFTDSNSQLVFKDLPIDDPEKRKPDISSIKKFTNWMPLIGLEDGIKRTIEYFKEHEKQH